jgi:hypothetical protein
LLISTSKDIERVWLLGKPNPTLAVRPGGFILSLAHQRQSKENNEPLCRLYGLTIESKRIASLGDLKARLHR